MDRKKSLERSKKSGISIAALLAKEGVSAVVPGGGLVFDIGKALLDHGRRYIADRNDGRLEKFHRILLDHDGQKEYQDDILNSEFEADDYHAILSSCLQDIEDQKTDVYARLLRAFIVESVSEDNRQLYIQAVKNFSMADIRYLRIIYINSKYDLMTAGGSSGQLKELFKTQHPLRQISLSRFVYMGFVRSNEMDLSELGQRFVQLCSTKDELTPDAIGKKAWTGVTVSILCFEIGSKDHSRFYTPLENMLWSQQIKSITHLVDAKRQITFNLSNAGLLLVGDKLIEGSYLEALQKCSRMFPLVRIDVTSKGAAQTLDGVEFKDAYSVAECPAGKEVEYLEQVVGEALTAFSLRSF